MHTHQWGTGKGIIYSIVLGALTWGSAQMVQKYNIIDVIQDHRQQQAYVLRDEEIRRIPEQVTTFQNDVDFLTRLYADPLPTHAPAPVPQEKAQKDMTKHAEAPKVELRGQNTKPRDVMDRTTTAAPLAKPAEKKGQYHFISRVPPTPHTVTRVDAEGRISYSPKERGRTRAHEVTAQHMDTKQTIDSLVTFNRLLMPGSDHGKIRSWSQAKDAAWYSIKAAPGYVRGGVWSMPATLQHQDNQEMLRFTLNTTFHDESLAFRLLFCKDNKLVGSVYNKPGTMTEVAVGPELYKTPVQYELVRMTKQGNVRGLEVLASGRNLVFEPQLQELGQPKGQPKEAPAAVSAITEQQAQHPYHATAQELTALHQRLREYHATGTATAYEQSVHAKLLPCIQQAILTKRDSA